MNEPLVSVIIPAYNGEFYIAEAIQSILNQNYSNHEILVLDNGSKDRTREIASSFPNVCYHYSEKADTAMARHLGITLSQGKYIAFLDQDDIWVEGKTKKQVEFLNDHPEYGAVIGQQKMFLQSGHTKPHWLKQVFLETAQPGYLPSALMVRRDTFTITGNFNTRFSFTSDMAWFFKATHMGVLIGDLQEVVVQRRIHGDNASHKHLELQKEILAILKNSLTERRRP